MKVQVLKNQKKNICPICKKEIIGYPALSRKDNKTEICSNCGVLQALTDFIQYEQRNKSNKKRSNKKMCIKPRATIIDGEIANHKRNTRRYVFKQQQDLKMIVSKEMRNHYNDKEFILDNLRYTLEILKYVNQELLEDKHFMLKAIEIDGQAIKYANEQLKNNKELVTRAIKNSSGYAFKYSSEELRGDKDVLYLALKNWRNAPYKSATKELQKEFSEYIKKYFEQDKI